MVVRIPDSIVIKIDADIEDARRKLAQLKKETFASAFDGSSRKYAYSRSHVLGPCPWACFSFS